MADWLGTGLQSPLIGFDSRRRLKPLVVCYVELVIFFSWSEYVAMSK